MFLHPYISSQISSQRQRETLARAEQQRLTRLARTRSRASRHAWRSHRPIHRVLRPALWLRTQAGA
ncbi:MAG: hypothetical protein ACLPKE_26005 [Streptosporangiaceae bacterium]